MLGRRTVTAEGDATFLTSAQVQPMAPVFNTLLAYIIFRLFKFFYGLDMFADVVAHEVKV